MQKVFGIVVSILLIFVLIISIMYGHYSNSVNFKYSTTIVDKANETLQVLISDNVETLPEYNPNLDDFVLPNLVENYYKKPDYSSSYYWEFTTWGGDDEGDSNMYGRFELSDRFPPVNSNDLPDGCKFTSKKQIAFKQIDDVVAVTNVKHSSGISPTPLTWLNGIGWTAIESEGNYNDFSNYSKSSCFVVAGQWYELVWDYSLDYVAAHHYKALCKQYLPEMGASDVNITKVARALVTNYCKLYVLDNKTYKVVKEVKKNIIAPFSYTYIVNECTNKFILTEKLIGMEY